MSDDAPLFFSTATFSRTVPRRRNGVDIGTQTPDGRVSNASTLSYFSINHFRKKSGGSRPPSPGAGLMAPMSKSVSTPSTPPNENHYHALFNRLPPQPVLHLGPQHTAKLTGNTTNGSSSNGCNNNNNNNNSNSSGNHGITTKLRRKGRSHNRSKSMVPLDLPEETALMMPPNPPPQLPTVVSPSGSTLNNYQLRTPSSLSLVSATRQTPRVQITTGRQPLTPHSPSASTTSSVYSADNVYIHKYSIPVPPQNFGQSGLRRGRSASQLRDEGKRWRIVQELIDTERTFVNDIRLALDIYWDHVPESSRTVVFGNLSDLAAVSTKFLHQLQARSDAAVDVIMELADDMERVFSIYCKNYEHAATAVQTVDTSARNKLLVGRTNSWDLASLLVKPVQRVLKYPLLLRELALVSSGEDGIAVHRAKQRVELMAERVNSSSARNSTTSNANRSSTATIPNNADEFTAAAYTMVHHMYRIACAWEDMYRPIEPEEQFQAKQLLNLPYSVIVRERCLLRASNWRKVIEMVKDELLPLLVEKQRMDKFFPTLHSIIVEFGVDSKSCDGQVDAFDAIDQSIEAVYNDNLPLNRLRWSSFWTETDQFFKP